MRLVLSTLLLALCLALGCAGPAQHARGMFRRDFACKDAHVTQHGTSLVRVHGCGVFAEYRCSKSVVVPAGPSAVGIAPGRCVLVSTESVEERARKPVTRSKKDGHVVLQGDISADGVDLRLYGAPVAQPDEVLVVWSPRRYIPDASGCTLDVLADGERLVLPTGELGGGRRTEYSQRLPLAAIERLGYAERVVGTVCGQPFNLVQSSRAALRTFVVRFKEEQTLAGAGPPPPAPPPPPFQTL